MAYIAYELLPDGRERVLARGLTASQVHTFRPPTAWAVIFRQER